jgi:uncharacterized protein (DUF2252 family)
MRCWLLLLVALAGACAPDLSDRARTIASVMAAADATLLRDRPALVAGKYNHMARSLYNFYRGAVPLFRADFRDGRLPASRTSFVSAALPWSTGDAHPENFGLLAAADGSLALEPNDLDGVDRYPYHWDLRRLVTGMVIAARLSNADDPMARAAARAAEQDIAEAAAQAYAEAVVRYAEGATRERIVGGMGVPLLEDLFRRGARDLAARAELGERTRLAADGTRRLIRGGIDEAEPENVQADLDPEVLATLPELLEAARASMPAPPPAEALTLLDAVREFGSGVASWPRVRMVALVRGPSDLPGDDVLLQLKELSDSGLDGFLPPGRFADDVPMRVRTGRALWGRPDGEARWTAETWRGLPMLVRVESEAHKTIRVARMEGALGTPEALVALGRALGGLLARLHATPVEGVEAAPALAALVRGRETEFAREHGAHAIALADQTERDFEDFREALRALGPELGLRRDVRAAPPPIDLRAFFGTPPPVLPFE